MENTLLTIFMSKKRKILFGVILLCVFCIGCSDQENEQGNESVITQGKIEELFVEEEYLSQTSSEEEEIQPGEEDRGVESPLAVYAAEQLGREIEGCHEADYDRDGEKEVIFSIEIERTDEKELDKLEIYFVDDDYEMTLIDTHEVGLYEDLRDREGTVWGSEGDELRDYRGVPVFMKNLLAVGSVGRGHYREIYYGWTGKEIAKLKDYDDLPYGVTTYLYDGSISAVKDGDFLKICDGDFSGVIGREENLIENLENWYKETEFDYYLECDVDHDGTNELYIADGGGESAAVFHKGEEGIECWVYDFHLALSDDGSFWHAQITWETNGKWRKDYMTSTVMRFDSNGNQDIMDEYEKVHIHYEKNRNEEDLTIFDKYAFQSMELYYWNGNSITQGEYLERGNSIYWYF